MISTAQHQTICRVLPPPSASDRGEVPLAEVFTVGPPASDASSHPSVTVMAMRGELCVHTVEEMRDTLVAAAQGTVDLVVDLTEVTLIGAAALGLFVSLDAQLAANGGRLLLRNAPPNVHRIIAVGGLTGFEDEARVQTPPVADEVGPPPEVRVRNRAGGRYVDVAVVCAVPLTDRARQDVTRHLVRLVGLRQPEELHLSIAQPGAGEPGAWADVASALEDVGGTLIVTRSEDQPAPR
jgi:anti-anti-sigma factor